MNDWDLLKHYASTRSQDAFKTLVARHIDFVYSAAVRQVRNRHLAEDITQGVFLILSQKARHLARQTPGVLEGWLFKVVRFLSANAIKREKRCRRHESHASLMPAPNADEAPDWEELWPHLDEALAQLQRNERDALFLRFFSSASHRDIATTLGISEVAVRKRVSRAIEKLRYLLAKQGVTFASATLGSCLTTHAVQAAPIGLATACEGISSGAGIGLAKGVSIILAAKAKLLTLSIVLLLAGVSGLLIQKLAQPLTRGSSQQPARPAFLVQQPDPATSIVAGVIRSADGEPIGAVQVLLATKEKQVDIYAKDPTGAASLKTGDDGAFAFDAPDGPCQIVARHQLGYAQLTREQLIESGGKVALHPWGRVEGTLRVGGKPAPRNVVSLARIFTADDPYSHFVSHTRETTTNDQGHFVFDQVAPGDAWLHRHEIVKVEQTIELLPINQYVKVRSGKTASINLGGSGRAVIGRMLPPTDPAPARQWTVQRTHGYRPDLYTPQPLFAALFRPSFTPQTTFEEQRKRYEHWSQLPAADIFKQNQRAWSMAIHPDGTFRIEDVRAGLHEIRTDYWELEAGAPFAEVLAEGSFSFVIPEMPTGRSDQPLDLGTLTLKVKKHLKTGQPAPDFQIQNADAKPFQSSDFRGKFILLCLWSKQRPLPEADIARIKNIYNKHRNDNKLTILTTEITGDLAAAQKFAADKQFPWPQFIAEPPRGLAQLFATESIPEEYLHISYPITLIDPQGRVAAKNLTGDAIGESVYRALFAE